MAHQPFEDWILGAVPASHHQIKLLGDHLASCDACRRLSAAWTTVDSLLQSPPVAAPPSGFMTRWNDRLTVYQQRREKQQNWLMLLSSVGGAGLLLSYAIILSILVDPSFPIQWIVSGVEGLTQTFAYLRLAWEVMTALLITWPGVVVIAWWSAFATLSTLLLLWVASLYQFAYVRPKR